ncbi:MAG: hypothetical protein ABI836_05305 [Gemmatimonadota bacterium]
MHIIPLIGFLLVPSSTPMTQDWVEKALSALMLPVVAAEARDAGVPDGQVRGLIEAIRGRRLPAEDAWRVLDEEVRVVKEGGPRENFGAFVQAKLDAGLRGRELAAAIHEEHRRRGMGRPDGRGNGEARDDQGRDRGEARPNEERGRREQNPAPPAREKNQRDTTRKEPRP